jgi:bifunctional DNase/RNase
MIHRATATLVLLLISIATSFDSGGKASAAGDLIKVEIMTLLTAAQGRGVVLVLRPEQNAREAEAQRVLALEIGLEEARSIGVAFEKIQFPRPLSHDLMKKIIDEYGGTVADCVITKMENSTYFAELHLKRGGRQITVDCRPSDAIALVMRTGAPIFVRKEVMEKYGVDPYKTEKAEKAMTT